MVDFVRFSALYSRSAPAQSLNQPRAPHNKEGAKFKHQTWNARVQLYRWEWAGVTATGALAGRPTGTVRGARWRWSGVLGPVHTAG
jgi:hypothetical protein